MTFDPNELDQEKELVDLLMAAFFASSADFNQSFRDMSEIDLESWLSSKKWGLGKLNQVKKFRLNDNYKSYESCIAIIIYHSSIENRFHYRD